MQRIDENTYIDDTLVTCAEYQLFIDEMCEQGKYYQPDHWISYQFPEGKAREPILGVRYRDASAFCEWLTKQDDGNWKFRLPSKIEADAFSMKSIGISPIGHWLNRKYQFTWIEFIPKDARTILRTIVDTDYAVELELELARARASIRAFDLARTINIASDLELDIRRDLAHKVKAARDLRLGSIIDRVRAGINTIDLEHIIELDIAQAVTSTLTQYLALDRNFAHTRDITQTLDRMFKLASALNSVIDRTTDLTTIDFSLSRHLDRALDIYVDFFTLQERIAGRSPAFEGIRLVKERIR